MSDSWRTAQMRPPPCWKCGIVLGVNSDGRHACQPFRIVSMRYGANAAIRIGETVVQFMTFRHTPREPGWSGE